MLIGLLCDIMVICIVVGLVKLYFGGRNKPLNNRRLLMMDTKFFFKNLLLGSKLRLLATIIMLLTEGFVGAIFTVILLTGSVYMLAKITTEKDGSNCNLLDNISWQNSQVQKAATLLWCGLMLVKVIFNVF